MTTINEFTNILNDWAETAPEGPHLDPIGASDLLRDWHNYGRIYYHWHALHRWSITAAYLDIWTQFTETTIFRNYMGVTDDDDHHHHAD